MMNKRIGLFFGSFNPIHVGHLIIAHAVCDEANLDQVWFIVSPQNPLKERTTLAHEFDRYDMVRQSVFQDERFVASDVEFGMPKPSYTIDTLAYLAQQYPGNEFHLIMGEDNYRTLHKWKNSEVIQRDYKIIVYPRGEGLKELDVKKGVTLVNAPLLNISASFIRNKIAEGKSIKYFVPEEACAFIESKNLYR